jgi:hypothetical protein
LRKLKILVVTVVTTLLVASPAFAAVFDVDVGFLTSTEVEGAGFDIEVGGFISDD